MHVHEAVRNKRVSSCVWSIAIVGLVMDLSAFATQQGGDAGAASLPRTEVRLLPSPGNGVEYKLYVSLPTSYAKERGKRP